jgi:hypothetical protein
MRSVAAAHPEHHGRQVKRPRIVEDVLLGGAFEQPYGL